ncbi:uncharacterized protein VDAG_07062 [Verticillium dahliae VdLs.17]|uniref:Uncharacterized protein n=1 Tax=Verticillium dahliae (strain VdLs.17 / ATCC MYA-4575 / FGSC 10137) TaxID=498257 RepID=G2XAF9_VERDV|nr:uncharacterized protein VDAG_07062 [Verticillium dahliae VdLs.17]EGY15898.1 hypothetical protein VDAG_07062 [Verticillium dahliae VdLs.17]
MRLPAKMVASTRIPIWNSAWATLNAQLVMEHSTQTDAPVAMGGYTFNTRDWGDYGSALVDHAPEKAAPKIPGCTAGQASNKNWKLTGPVLQAYNAMRGSRMAAGDPMEIHGRNCRNPSGAAVHRQGRPSGGCQRAATAVSAHQSAQGLQISRAPSLFHPRHRL